MVTTGFTVTIKRLTGGTCTCTADVISISGGTCTTIPYIDTYSKSWTREDIEYTGFGDKLKKVIPGMPSYSLDFSGGLDLTNAQQLAIFNALVCSSVAPQVIKLFDGGKTFTLRGYISGTDTGSTAGGKSTFSAKMNMTHLPTLA
jgi:hypothetical protein